MIVQLVTDRRLLFPSATGNGWFDCVLLQARHAVDAGIDAVQIRERDLEGRELARLVTAVVGLARGTRTRVLVNDRVDVALACGADGVHLRGDSLASGDVRRLVPRGFVVGRSVHSVDEAAAAQSVDYVIAGTVWPTVSKPAETPFLGPAGLREIVRAARVPVLAIGGVSLDRIGDVAASGAAGIAAIGLFADLRRADGCRSSPLYTTVEDVRRRFDTSGSHS